MYVFLAIYSFKISFCVVPRNVAGEKPCNSATLIYSESKVDAVELIVIDVLTLSIGIPSKHVTISFSELMATPVLPTSPSDCESSESRPV